MGSLKENRGNSKGVARTLNLGLSLVRGLLVRHGRGRADHPGERGHCRGAARRRTLGGVKSFFCFGAGALVSFENKYTDQSNNTGANGNGHKRKRQEASRGTIYLSVLPRTVRTRKRMRSVEYRSTVTGCAFETRQSRKAQDY